MSPQPARPEDRRRCVETLPWADGWPHGLRSEAFAEDLLGEEEATPLVKDLLGIPLSLPGH
jgi:hypothetical protein